MNSKQATKRRVQLEEAVKNLPLEVTTKCLPSLFQIGDRVSVIFPGTGTLSPCYVLRVAFDENNTFYDLEVPFLHHHDHHTEMKSMARLHNVKQWHVRNPE
jgi:hypothetical protein